MTELNQTTQKQLIEALILLLEKQFNKAVERVETHISTLLLVDGKVFKIKKPVDFGFLNFTELHQRKFYCEEELRLNRRLAAQIYEQVVAVTGDINRPQINGSGATIEYLVQMKRFNQQELFDQKLKNGSLKESHITELAGVIADFHLLIKIDEDNSASSNCETISNATIQNFDQLRDFMQTQDDALQQLFGKLEQWSKYQNKQLEPVFKERHESGFIRECHGDMHLGNITIYDNQVTIFDGIEFNPAFRWIDVISEIAFITMDLQSSAQHAFSNILLNHYLELTGDYNGLKLLGYYQVYRAMVRAKVTALRLAQLQDNDDEYHQQLATFKHYLEIAWQYTQATKPKLLITHGVSGTGKSCISKMLLGNHPFIRIRSDVERKRLYPSSAERYSADASAKTYRHLHQTADNILKSGYSVIIDATYLEQQYRNEAASIAEAGCYPFLIISLQYPVTVLEQRITQRLNNKNDASEATIAVLHKQLDHAQPLTDEESRHSLVISDQDNVSERITFTLGNLI